ncbi:putative PHP family metal-dependent phosphoesterase [Candidatus Kinetoplastibacterium desouzaii TCC079E]|uniref:Putative PHP family metal-dependent phosphoesterase n=1 Tax=Candidatus Kinetoplastidibacterium desouzai TCC079E TaxID=1208919 RepID=M1LU93_9PROT|nr:PHP domain-containing protein [Candidatus Kinetoplastibacterium desouzaii]AGF46864.1 putative PHP family metal-dependent phosphoesterase [Candidatus Kinetoplastibacterium desouzaii TCC079E]
MSYSNILIDLHCHSNISDGLLSPEELAHEVFERRIKIWSLTDHDTTEGLLRAESESKNLNLFFINGVEISSTWNDKVIHILGLNIDYKNTLLLNLLEKNRNLREERAFLISKYLDSLGFVGSVDFILSHLKVCNFIGRMNFARFLVFKGYCKNIKQAFSKYLSDKKVGNINTKYPSIDQVIFSIKSSGGKAFIAHPFKYMFTNNDLYTLMNQFSKLGGDGIEFPLMANKHNYKLTMDLITRYNFLISYGSDFHSHKDDLMTLEKYSSIPNNLKKAWWDS